MSSLTVVVEPTERQEKLEKFRQKCQYFVEGVGEVAAVVSPIEAISKKFIYLEELTSGLDITLEAGTIRYNSTITEYPRTPILLYSGATNRIYLDIVDYEIKVTSGSWPLTPNIPLYEIVTDVVSVQSVTDKRTWLLTNYGATSTETYPVEEKFLVTKPRAVFNTSIAQILSEAVYVDGVRQRSGSDYVVTGNKQITFLENVPAESIVLICGKMMVSDIIIACIGDSLTASGTQQDFFPTNTLPLDRELAVFVDGVRQHNNYTVDYSTGKVTLATAVPNGTVVNIYKMVLAVGDLTLYAVPGGNEGDYLVKNGAGDGQYGWYPFLVPANIFISGVFIPNIFQQYFSFNLDPSIDDEVISPISAVAQTIVGRLTGWNEIEATAIQDFYINGISNTVTSWNPTTGDGSYDSVLVLNNGNVFFNYMPVDDTDNRNIRLENTPFVANDVAVTYFYESGKVYDNNFFRTGFIKRIFAAGDSGRMAYLDNSSHLNRVPDGVWTELPSQYQPFSSDWDLTHCKVMHSQPDNTTTYSCEAFIFVGAYNKTTNLSNVAYKRVNDFLDNTKPWTYAHKAGSLNPNGLNEMTGKIAAMCTGLRRINEIIWVHGNFIYGMRNKLNFKTWFDKANRSDHKYTISVANLTAPNNYLQLPIDIVSGDSVQVERNGDRMTEGTQYTVDYTNNRIILASLTTWKAGQTCIVRVNNPLGQRRFSTNTNDVASAGHIHHLHDSAGYSWRDYLIGTTNGKLFKYWCNNLPDTTCLEDYSTAFQTCDLPGITRNDEITTFGSVGIEAGGNVAYNQTCDYYVGTKLGKIYKGINQHNSWSTCRDLVKVDLKLDTPVHKFVQYRRDYTNGLNNPTGDAGTFSEKHFLLYVQTKSGRICEIFSDSAAYNTGYNCPEIFFDNSAYGGQRPHRHVSVTNIIEPYQSAKSFAPPIELLSVISDGTIRIALAVRPVNVAWVMESEQSVGKPMPLQGNLMGGFYEGNRFIIVTSRYIYVGNKVANSLVWTKSVYSPITTGEDIDMTYATNSVGGSKWVLANSTDSRYSLDGNTWIPLPYSTELPIKLTSNDTEFAGITADGRAVGSYNGINWFALPASFQPTNDAERYIAIQYNTFSGVTGMGRKNGTYVWFYDFITPHFLNDASVSIAYDWPNEYRLFNGDSILEISGKRLVTFITTKQGRIFGTADFTSLFELPLPYFPGDVPGKISYDKAGIHFLPIRNINNITGKPPVFYQTKV